MVIEEYILFVSSLKNDKKFKKESLKISIERLFKNLYEKYEKEEWNEDNLNHLKI